MRKTTLGIFVTLPIFSVLIMVMDRSANSQEAYDHEDRCEPNEVLVKFDKSSDRYLIQGALESLSGRIITYLGKVIEPSAWDPNIKTTWSFLSNPYILHVRVPEAIGTEHAVNYLKLCPQILSIERNYLVSPTAIYPADPHFNKLWGLFNGGQSGGTIGADIDAPSAWNVSKGSPSIVVAIIDTGVDYGHMDLEANIWTNPDEIPGNGLDDDNNGYIDDTHGWDFYDHDNDPSDWLDHGTHVAGILGAISGNNTGIVGINWNAKLMPLKAGCNSQGELNTAAIIAAIEYATANGAHLLNNSWGGRIYSQLTYEAIEAARDAGKLFIAAAGNDASNNDVSPFYPASYSLDNIVAVLSTNHNDSLSSFSNFGGNSVDVGAPGGSGYPLDNNDIYSLRPNDGYGYLWGTSQATPLVTGVAAMVWGCRPDLTWAQVKNAIISSVDHLVSLNGKCSSGGRLNAYRALTVYPPTWLTAPDNLQGSSECDNISLEWDDNSNNELGFRIERKSGPYWNLLAEVGPGVTTYVDSGLPCGQLFYYRVYAFSQDGNSLYSPQIGKRTTPCPYCEGDLIFIATPYSVAGKSGERMTYTYTLTNRGEMDVDSIQVTDDYRGLIVENITLKKGECKTFTNSIVLSRPLAISAEAKAIIKQDNDMFHITRTARILIDVKE